MRGRRRLTLLAGLCHATAVALVLAIFVPLLWLAGGLMWLWLAVRLVCALPVLLAMAWSDWRFARRNAPFHPYPLRRAVWIQVRMWLTEAGMR
jgi:hypothetical protein